jgi:hypothetical protein
MRPKLAQIEVLTNLEAGDGPPYSPHEHNFISLRR